MNKIFKSFLIVFGAFLLQSSTYAYGVSDKQDLGSKVVYALPKTSIRLSVEAIKTIYTPGPYAVYAEKYLGLNVESKPKDSYSLKSIKFSSHLEIDESEKFILDLDNINKKSATESLFKFTSQGLLMFFNQSKALEENWRFPTIINKNDGIAQGATENFTSVETTLYKNVKNNRGGYDRVPVQQKQVVQKSIEKKAQEIADMIFELRQKRFEIITGDTDATFSGEAMGAVINEINRLENDYLSLFLGTYETAPERMEFDVLPKAETPNQLYIAFRLSDSEGLVPSSEISGRPIVLQIIPENNQKEKVLKIEESDGKKKKSKVDVEKIYYKAPATCLVKIMDGDELLLQTRIPIYQLGETLSMPIL